MATGVTSAFSVASGCLTAFWIWTLFHIEKRRLWRVELRRSVAPHQRRSTNLGSVFLQCFSLANPPDRVARMNIGVVRVTGHPGLDGNMLSPFGQPDCRGGYTIGNIPGS